MRFWVELSLYLPCAVNCAVVPGATAGVLGETVIDVRITGGGVPPPAPGLLEEPQPQPRAMRTKPAARTDAGNFLLSWLAAAGWDVFGETGFLALGMGNEDTSDPTRETV